MFLTQTRPKSQNQDIISQPGNHRHESETAINLAVVSTGERSGASISRAGGDGQGQGEGGAATMHQRRVSAAPHPLLRPQATTSAALDSIQIQNVQDRMMNLPKSL